MSIEMDSHGQHTDGAYARYLPEDVQRARRIVAGRARDAEDCRELLEMLGLDENVRVLEES